MPEPDSPEAYSRMGQSWAPVLELTHNHGTESDPSFSYHNGNTKPKVCTCFTVVSSILPMAIALGSHIVEADARVRQYFVFGADRSWRTENTSTTITSAIISSMSTMIYPLHGCRLPIRPQLTGLWVSWLHC